MASDELWLSANGQLALTASQCLVQGILIPLFTTFFSTRSTRSALFTTYVVAVNLLCLGQTAISIIQTADLLNSTPFREPLILGYTIHTVVIGTLVQAFFLDRCWRILKKRLWPAIPLVLLWLAGLAAGVLLVAYKPQLTIAGLAYDTNPQDPSAREAFKIAEENVARALAVWAFSWFILELVMTAVAIFFLYRVRTGLSVHDGIFSTIWQILWISVTPPFILMSIVIVDGYAIPGTLGVMAKVAVGITAKFFALSLMINLVGQGHVRDKFNDFHLTPPTISSNRPTGVISEAVFAHDIVTVHSYTDVEHRRSASDAGSTRFGSLDAHHKQDEQEGIVEKHEVPTTPPPGSQPYHGTQHISFSP